MIFYELRYVTGYNIEQHDDKWATFCGQPESTVSAFSCGTK